MNTDQFTIQNIVSYCDIDTKIVMRVVCKQFNGIETVFNKIESFVNPLIVITVDKKTIPLVTATYTGSTRRTKYECKIHKYEYDDINYGLWGACEGGHSELISYMINLGADDWLSCCCAACRGGQFEIVKLMFKKAKQHNISDINLLLSYACWGANIEIVNYVIGEMDYNTRNGMYGNVWNIGFTEACKRKKQLNFSSNRVKDIKRIGQYDKIIKLMIEKGSNGCSFCNKTLGEH